ncbi:DUF5007 domain-containing protein [Sabulibacter ruber]|uniref:DUF5007 domain-containing protein n=1 Tax=Sabulibacter ruber TaxID=2811901 RepID=UPI001A96FBC4
MAGQGVNSFSPPIQLDGSTQPVKVKLLAVRNKATGAPADELLQEFEMQTYKANVTPADSTLDLLYKKLTVEKRPVLSVNEIGGRIEVTSASSRVSPGTYTIDVEVSNIAGTRVVKDACDIVIRESAPYTLGYTAWSTSTMTGEVFTGISEPLNIKVETDVTGPNKIIFKFVDKNGTPFNPEAGEVYPRAFRGHFGLMNTFYKVVKTPTSLEWEYPPVFPFPLVSSTNGFLNYYRIDGAATDIGVNINPVFEIRFNQAGTHTVTVKLTNAVRK